MTNADFIEFMECGKSYLEDMHKHHSAGKLGKEWNEIAERMELHADGHWHLVFMSLFIMGRIGLTFLGQMYLADYTASSFAAGSKKNDRCAVFYLRGRPAVSFLPWSEHQKHTKFYKRSFLLDEIMDDKTIDERALAVDMPKLRCFPNFLETTAVDEISKL